MSEERLSTDVAHTNGIIRVPALADANEKEDIRVSDLYGVSQQGVSFLRSLDHPARVQSPKGLKAPQGDQMLSLFLFWIILPPSSPAVNLLEPAADEVSVSLGVEGYAGILVSGTHKQDTRAHTGERVHSRRRRGENMHAANSHSRFHMRPDISCLVLSPPPSRSPALSLAQTRAR